MQTAIFPMILIPVEVYSPRDHRQPTRSHYVQHSSGQAPRLPFRPESPIKLHNPSQLHRQGTTNKNRAHDQWSAILGTEKIVLGPSMAGNIRRIRRRRNLQLIPRATSKETSPPAESRSPEDQNFGGVPHSPGLLS